MSGSAKRRLEMGYVPRRAFLDFHKREQRFACLVCHRRAGKTVATLNDLLDSALRCKDRGALFAYIAPQRNQAKGVSWGMMRRFLEPLGPTRYIINEAELTIKFWNGAEIRFYGADNPDALRGIGLNGVVLDEFADMEPRLWPEVIRPALADRRGWAVFIGTPRGHNQFWSIFQQAQKEGWFWVDLKASQSGILPEEELKALRDHMTEEQYAQELETNFEAAVHGAYYAKLIGAAREGGRICSVPWEPKRPVHTAWDLGFADATAICFAQVVGQEVHIIDYHEASGESLGYYVNILRGKPYTYGRHILPADVGAHELGTGKSRLEVLQSLGLFSTQILQNQLDFADGINAVRTLIPRCWFDAVKCDRLIEALTMYRSDVDKRVINPDTKQPVLKNKPVHDWTSHGADSFRYLAQGLDDGGFHDKFWKPIQYPKKGFV